MLKGERQMDTKDRILWEIELGSAGPTEAIVTTIGEIEVVVQVSSN